MDDPRPDYDIERSDRLNPQGQFLTKSEVLTLQWKAISSLPNKQGWPFHTGVLALALNSSFTGLVALSFFRRMMKVRMAYAVSSLPMVIIPFVGTAMTWQAFVCTPLLLGKLNCPICVQLRGGLMNSFFGFVYPTVLAGALVSALAARYETVEMPYKKGIVGLYKFYSKMGRHMKSRLVTIALYQFVLGYYVATKGYKVYTKLGSPFVEVKDDEMY
ncbi:transmembrane protein 126A-like [Glandiceps talaboti]